MTFNLNDNAVIPEILLDIQSTVDVFIKDKLLKYKQDGSKPLSLHFIAVMTNENKIGDLPEYGKVWYYEYGLTNILSLNNVKKKYQVTYDNATYDCSEVQKERWY